MKLLKIEFRKILTYKVFWILTGLYFLFLGLGIFMAEFILNDWVNNFNKRFPIPMPHVTLYFFPDVWQNLTFFARLHNLDPEAALPHARALAAVDPLDEGARAELKQDAACLVQKRPASATIEGHTDERGTTAYNLALGQRRADSVRGYLQDLGVGADLGTISFGKELPLVKGSGEEAWSQNRRAELRLPGERRSDGLQVADR